MIVRNKNGAVIESELLAGKWKIYKAEIDEDAYLSFRSLQISAFHIEMKFAAHQVTVTGIDYLYEKENTFLEVVIDEKSVDEFYKKADSLWRGTYEDLPLHRNDRWDSKKNKPVVSEAYRDPATASLVLMIKFNTRSVAYHFPTANELRLNDRRENRYL
jgi:hypothetical protein